MNKKPTITDRIIGFIRGSRPWQFLVVVVGDLLGCISCRNFLILSSARSGSNLLVDYLQAHPSIHCHNEILNPEYFNYDFLTRKSELRNRVYIRSLFFKNPRLRSRSPRQYVGAKILIHQFSPVGLSIARVLRDLGNPRLIILYRTDLLESYVSLQIALRNGQWYSTTCSNEESVFVEWEEFLAYCDERRASWRACLTEIGKSCDLHFVAYDSLVTDPRTEVNEVLRFIGVDGDCEPIPRSVRQNPWPMSKKIVNFADLESREDFRGAFRYLSLPDESKLVDGNYASSTMTPSR